MDTISVSFLDMNYNLPADIITYKNYHHGFELLRQELLCYMVDNYGDCDNWPDIENAERKFKEFAEQCVRWLCEDGIYDKTVDDFLTDNAGFDMYQETVKQTCIKQAEILLSYLKGLQADMIEAESEAASTITGMGFKVYSSSIIDLGVWAAMEESTLKKQRAAADEQYNRLVSVAVDRGTAKSDKQKNELNRTYWLPKMKESIDLFIAVLFEKYIQALIDAQMFNPDALSYLDFRRAEMILKNVSSAADRTQLIREAFLKCPFCLIVYTVAIEHNMFGNNECSTAKVFGIESDLIDTLQGYLEALGKNMDAKESVIIGRMTPSATALATIKGTSLNQEINIFLQKRRDKKRESLRKLQEFSYDSPKYDELIRCVLSRSIYDIIISFSDKEKVEAKFINYVCVDYLKGDDSTYYDAEKKQTIITLLENAKYYVDEAIRRKQKFIEATEHFKKVNGEINEQIIELSTQREKLGVFGFAKRKSIDERVTQLQEQGAAAKNELKEIKKSFITMYSSKIFLDI